MTNEETWRPIPGLEFYEASDQGRVRSLDRTLEMIGRWGPMKRFHKGRVLRLKPKPNGCGGIYWSFFAGEDGGYWQVNRAVCTAFNGPPPSGIHEAAHLDGDTDNNAAANLEWSTPIQNASHKIRHGTTPTGSKNGSSRLREGDIKPIFEAYCRGDGPDDIAATNGVSRGTIIRVVSSRSWAHVAVGELREAAKQRSRLNLEAAWAAAERRLVERGHSLVAP